LTTSVHSRRPSVHKRPGEAIVLRRFFRNNFVIFSHRSKRIALLESVNFSTYAFMQIFNVRDGHITTFRHHSVAYICQIPGHRLSRLSNGTPSGLGFQSVPLVWGKTISCSCRLCAGQSKGTIKTRKMLCLDLAPPTLQNSGFFFTIAPVLTSTLTVCR